MCLLPLDLEGFFLLCPFLPLPCHLKFGNLGDPSSINPARRQSYPLTTFVVRTGLLFFFKSAVGPSCKRRLKGVFAVCETPGHSFLYRLQSTRYLLSRPPRLLPSPPSGSVFEDLETWTTGHGGGSTRPSTFFLCLLR